MIQESPGQSAADQSTIQLDRLTKFYGKQRGIEDITLEVRRGEVLGLLGPNGAGKTTAIRVLMGFLRPNSGNAQLLGFDSATQSVEIRRRVGYLPGDPALYPSLTGSELLHLAMRARALSQSVFAEDLVQSLDATMDREMRKCSRGMRQKVALVASLFHDPDVLILDEPTSGLDPLAQRALLTHLNKRAEDGRTVVLSSHVLSEVEQIADRVAILRDGHLITEDTIENIREKKYREVTIAFHGPAPSLDDAGEVEVVWQHENRITFRVRGDARTLIQTLARADITDVSITEPSLEELFIDFYRGGSSK